MPVGLSRVSHLSPPTIGPRYKNGLGIFPGRRREGRQVRCYASQMDPKTAVFALQVLDRAWSALEAARERAQASKDAVLKGHISSLYDEFLALKSAIVRISDENAALRQSQVQGLEKPEIRQVGRVNYYYIGNAGPYCQKCYDLDRQLRLLTAQQRFAGGTGRNCQICKTVFIEAASSPPRTRMKNYWE